MIARAGHRSNSGWPFPYRQDAHSSVEASRMGRSLLECSGLNLPLIMATKVFDVDAKRDGGGIESLGRRRLTYRGCIEWK